MHIVKKHLNCSLEMYLMIMSINKSLIKISSHQMILLRNVVGQLILSWYFQLIDDFGLNMWN